MTSIRHRRLALAAALLAGLALAAPGWGTADRAILLALHRAGPAWLPAAAANLTALGSGVVLTLVVAFAAVGMIVGGARRHAALLVGATASGSLLVDAVKRLVARPRPDLVDHLVAVSSSSFPSAHAANSAIVYLMLGGLAARLASTVTLARYIRGVALLLTLLIGSSRVYLGVHWPSDVTAGWLFGLGWAMAAARLSRSIARGEEPR